MQTSQMSQLVEESLLMHKCELVEKACSYNDEDKSTDCTSSVVGDISDLASMSGDSISTVELQVEGVELIVRRTFVEFRCQDDCAPKLRRVQSAPLLLAPEAAFRAKTSTSSWADVTEADAETFVEEPMMKSESSKKTSRKSGRARQREQKRRQLRTPSPEMRNPYCECFRTLPAMCL